MIWNGGDDFPVGVTRRIEDGVVVVELDDDGDECLRLFVGLSRCESAERQRRENMNSFVYLKEHTEW